MKKKWTIYTIRILLFTSTLVSLYFVPWILIKAWILPLPSSIEEQVEQSLEYVFDGMIVYVDQKGKSPQYYTSGWHNKKKKIPTKPNALFCIASISKLYVAVAITKLAKEKKINMDNTIADYFPEYEKRIQYADKISIKMLVQHRSGIPNFTDQNKFWQTPPTNNEAVLDLVLDLPANFKPNKKYEYCNTNFLLLSKLIKKITGRDQKFYIQEKILSPLQLKNTYCSNREINMNEAMSGYYVGIEEDQKYKDQGMFATAENVAIFLRAINDGSIFNEGEKTIYDSIYVYNHTGLVPGYQSIAKYYKDIDTVVIQFNNTTDFNGYEWNLAEIFYSRILKIIYKKTDNLPMN